VQVRVPKRGKGGCSWQKVVAGDTRGRVVREPPLVWDAAAPKKGGDSKGRGEEPAVQGNKKNTKTPRETDVREWTGCVLGGQHARGKGSRRLAEPNELHYINRGRTVKEGLKGSRSG